MGSLMGFPGIGLSCRRAGLVIAHPDDESMFFTPALSALLRQGSDVFVLCLSSGDYDGLGHLRKGELVQACRLLGVQPARVFVVEEPELQDGMSAEWPVPHIAKLVHAFVQERALDLVLTFDAWGVSGHPNHCAVHRGVVHMTRHMPGFSRREDEEGDTPGCRVLVLETTGLLRKYSGLLDAAVSLMQSSSSRWWGRGGGTATASSSSRRWRRQRCCVIALDPIKVWRAMAAHETQFVWYRKLFVVFSRYVYVNTFLHLGPSGSADSPIGPAVTATPLKAKIT